MKAIYYFDPETKLFTSIDLIEDTAEVPANATDIQPIAADGSGMYDPKWDGSKWVGLTPEEFEEAHKDDPKPDAPEVEPTPEQTSITAMSQQMSDMNECIESLEQALTAMAKGGN